VRPEQRVLSKPNCGCKLRMPRFKVDTDGDGKYPLSRSRLYVVVVLHLINNASIKIYFEYLWPLAAFTATAVSQSISVSVAVDQSSLGNICAVRGRSGRKMNHFRRRSGV
jgi:hypothetical protein